MKPYTADDLSYPPDSPALLRDILWFLNEEPFEDESFKQQLLTRPWAEVEAWALSELDDAWYHTRGSHMPV